MHSLWVRACFWLAAYLLSPVHGRADSESCHAEGCTDADPADTVGVTLAQLKFHATSRTGDSSPGEGVRVGTENLTGNPQNHTSSTKASRASNAWANEPLFTAGDLNDRFMTNDTVLIGGDLKGASLTWTNQSWLTGAKPDNASLTLENYTVLSGEHPEPEVTKDLTNIPVPGMEAEDHGGILEGEGGELSEEAFAHYVIIPVAVALIASLFMSRLLEKFHITFLPESALTLALGMCIGVYMRSEIGDRKVFQDQHVFNETCSTLLTLCLLPILMFEAGWTLRKRDFASQMEYILLYAIFGSLIAFLTVALLIHLTGQLGYHKFKHTRTALAYASLIAATDPVATLATYSSLKVDPLLNILVFGDSTFNDAVAIVLFRVFNDNNIMGTLYTRPSFGEVSKVVWQGIVVIFFGSLGLGLLMGFIFLMLMRIFDMRGAQRSSIIALIAMAFISFSTAEVMGLSGIIATVYCSMFLGIYARFHLSDGGSLLADFFTKQLATIMDHMVFLLSGFCAAAYDCTGWRFSIQAMIICLIARAAGVYPISVLANFFKRRVGRAMGKPERDWHLISSGACFMMWHASLRGGISLTLCMQLGDWVDELEGPGSRKALQTATFMMICVFLIVFGGSTEYFLKRLGIPMGEDAPRDKLWEQEMGGQLKRIVGVVNDKILMPVCVGDTRKSMYQRAEKTLEVEDMLRQQASPDSRYR